MTENEAREKWCPFVQYRTTDYGPRSNMPNNEDGFCVASDCMAWREIWYSPYGSPHGTRQSTGEGYCGLAGKP